MFEYPKEIDGNEFPPFIIGRLEYHRPAQNGKLSNGCRMAICKELPDAETHIYRQWSYEGETEPRKWHSYGIVPKAWTVPQILTMIQVETTDWQLRKKPWDTEAKPVDDYGPPTTPKRNYTVSVLVSESPEYATIEENFLPDKIEPPEQDLPPLEDLEPPPVRRKPIKKVPPAKHKPTKAVPKKKAGKEEPW